MFESIPWRFAGLSLCLTLNAFSADPEFDRYGGVRSIKGTALRK